MNENMSSFVARQRAGQNGGETNQMAMMWMASLRKDKEHKKSFYPTFEANVLYQRGCA